VGRIITSASHRLVFSTLNPLAFPALIESAEAFLGKSLPQRPALIVQGTGVPTSYVREGMKFMSKPRDLAEIGCATLTLKDI
jgi:hypothetical protein